MAGDLGSNHLEMIYKGIKKDVGEREASNFVRFVNNLDDMAASAFIVAFERFWNQDCEPEVGQHTSDRMRLDAPGDALLGQALGAIASAFYSAQMSEEEYRQLSDQIKAPFVRDHFNEIPEDEHRQLTSCYHFA